MADKKIIAVMGATGAQGGGLVRAILDDPSGGFAARAITRDVNSEKAKALARAGAEVVAADVDDAASLERAFAGAYGAFCVTFYWDHFSPEKELAHAAAMVQAAKGAKLQHVIWSTLEDTRQWVPLERQPDADADGQVQGAALRRQGRGESPVHGRGAAGHAAADFVLLGQLYLFRHGSQEGAGRKTDAHAADGRQETAGDCGGGHRTVRVRDLSKTNANLWGRRWGLPASI